jgi:Secretion system C-terminal sorting domain
MKTILLTFVILFGNKAISFAQGGVSQGGGGASYIYVCSISYLYDDNGNRTQRTYGCQNVPTIPTTPLIPKQIASSDAITSIVFPNPSNGIFTICTNKDVNKANINITDMQGKVLKQFSYEGKEAEYDIRALPIGQYMIQFVMPETKQTHQLLKVE